MSAEAGKRAAGRTAAALVRDGTTVGLGTGSTAVFFVEALAERVKAERLTLRCVATSEATAALATRLGLSVEALDDVGAVDLTVDGADEVGPGLALIKGGGAALLREKLVWEASARRVVIADAGKRVARLGAFPLPVEVVAFGHATTAMRIAEVLAALDYAVQPRLRAKEGRPVATDAGAVLYDLPLKRIGDAELLADALKLTTGVVEHGLFLSLADEALIGSPDGRVERLAP